jgi:hypothetical protein
LELAVKYQNYIEIVIGFRQRYLEEYEKQEKNKIFLKYRKEVNKLNLKNCKKIIDLLLFKKKRLTLIWISFQPKLKKNI